MAVISAQTAVLAAQQTPAALTSPAAAGAAQTTVGGTVQSTGDAIISGTLTTPAGDPMVDTRVQARNLLTGEVESVTRTTDLGEYSFSLNAGNYVLEVVDDDGQIIAVSSFVSAAAASVVVTTMTVASGALSAVTSATGIAAALGATAAKGISAAAAAAGVAGVVVPPERPIASPSR